MSLKAKKCFGIGLLVGAALFYVGTAGSCVAAYATKTDMREKANSCGFADYVEDNRRTEILALNEEFQRGELTSEQYGKEVAAINKKEYDQDAYVKVNGNKYTIEDYKEAKEKLKVEYGAGALFATGALGAAAGGAAMLHNAAKEERRLED